MVTVEKAEAIGRLQEEQALVATDPAQAALQQAAFETRWGGVQDIRMLKSVQARLPQGADEAASAVYERIADLEKMLAAPNLLSVEYGEGTATEPDEIFVIPGFGTLLTAEHATDPVRKATLKREGADQGTAGLAAAIAYDGVARALIMRGKQTGNAGVDPGHPMKQAILNNLDSGSQSIRGFLSLHSKLPGQAPSLFDDMEVHGYLGLGRYEPSEATLAAAEQIMSFARGLGLRVEIGNNTRHPIYTKNPNWTAPGPMQDRVNGLDRDDNGQLKINRLAGISANSTTSWLSNPDNPAGRSLGPVMQLEMSNSLCVTAADRYVRDPKAAAMGVYLGYLLAIEASRIIG